MIRLAVLVALVLAACGGGDGEEVSCQDAVTHYYDVGCAFFDPNSGAAYSTAQAITLCRDTLIGANEVGGTCESDVYDWTACMASVPGGDNAGCNCADEQEDLLTCG